MLLLGLLMLYDQFLVSGKNVVIVVFFAPMLCVLSLFGLVSSIRSYRRMRTGQRALRAFEQSDTPRHSA
jgi:hypothetical protein